MEKILEILTRSLRFEGWGNVLPISEKGLITGKTKYFQAFIFSLLLRHKSLPAKIIKTIEKIKKKRCLNAMVKNTG